jgi:uncharacterized protein
MRLHPIRFATLALLFCAFAGAAWAEFTFPALTGRVVDAANILNAGQRAALEQKLAAQEAKTTDQFVVATVPSLEGTDIADYGNRLFRHWQLGQKDKDNGALLLVAPNEKQVRIEVGYGLEGVLTDAVASTIIRTAIVPAFRNGDFAGGIDKGADAVIEILNLDPAEAELRARQAEEPAMTDDDWISLLFFAAMVLFFLYVVYRQVRYGRSTRTLRRGAAAGGVSSWEWGRGSSGGWSGGGGGWSSGGGGFSGGGGSSGGGGASGSW